ncbi:MAG: fused MFS/spermidine synthase [Victivallales bacterium]|nr:fused MFS/spermidine synthase [Victivallales bacterium]
MPLLTPSWRRRLITAGIIFAVGSAEIIPAHAAATAAATTAARSPTIPTSTSTTAPAHQPGFWQRLGDFFLPHPDRRKVLLQKQTPYFLITVEEDYQHYRHLVFNPNHGSQGIWDPATPQKIVSRYCRFSTLFLTAITRPPQRVLFIGLGAGIVPRFVRERFPDTQIDLVEIDPEIPGIAAGYFGFARDDRMDIVIADGRDFINRTRKHYDVIFIDAYTAVNIPFQLTTVEFFRRIRAALTPHGIMVANIAHLGKDDFIGAEIRTAGTVFPALAVFICGDGANYLLLGRNGGAIDSARMKAAAEKLSLPAHPELNLADMIATRMEPDELTDRTRGAIILKDDFAPVETLR